MGNEDAGQMSAWYVLAAAGLHPACPGDTRMEITSPSSTASNCASTRPTRRAGHSPRGARQQPLDVYIQRAVLNGQGSDTASHLDFADIAAGGTLELYMGDTPNTRWGI